MHEFALYGAVAGTVHRHLRQQLAGISRMQPQEVNEIHLIFRAKPPIGLAHLPSAGGSQGVVQQDAQRVKAMLNSSLYYVQLVGELSSQKTKTHNQQNEVQENGSNENEQNSISLETKWTLDFKDTPDPGKQAVSSRLVSRTVLESGDITTFLEQFGYEYVSRYFVRGCRFFDQDTTLFLYQILHLPQVLTASEAVNVIDLHPFEQLQAVDPGHQYILQASILLTDGNHPDLKDRATRQLLAMKQTLRQAVDLTPGDRLALDTKIPVGRRI